MKCPRCQHDNPPGATFCEECASLLARKCSNCGGPLRETAKFCPACAQPVAPPLSGARRFAAPDTYTPGHIAERILTSKSALEGERKRVTVLFADLKGSMELLADRDPEDARKLLDPVLERMMEAVHRYEGTVNQIMGDGIMALFGAPLAHEDHAVRACFAALRMQDAVARYAEDLRRLHGVDAQIRVGLNSGEVVVRAIGSDLRMDYTAIGQTTHLAARMEQLARPGTTLMTGPTFNLAEGYVQAKSLGPTPIKGIAELIPVYELIGTGSARSRLQASAARGLTRFVGRDAEVEELRRALEHAASGSGQVVAVTGEPGVGKSRLLHEFIHSERTRGWLVLQSNSASYGKATAHLPVVDLLKSYFKIADRDDTRTLRAKVIGNVLTLDEALKNSIPALLWLLDALPEDHEFLALDPSQRRDDGVHAVKRVLLRETQSQPVLLVLEDLHWIDAETQVLLDALVDNLHTIPVLLAVNFRPGYQHSWGSKSCYREIRIDPLAADSAEALLDPLLGADPGLRPLRRLLIERTQGNPLFLEESVRSLVETEVLVGERGAYRLGKDPIGIQVPATVHAILAARIDRLPPADKQLLQTASVISKDVPWALLREVSELREDELQHSLARLHAAEFVYETKLYPDLEYTFKHALTQEVAYAGLLQDRRRALHARIVEGIEHVYADRLAEHVEQLLHHAFRGEVWHKAFHYLRQSGSPASHPSIDAVLGNPESSGHLWWRGEHDRAVALARREQAVAANFGNFELAIVANLRLGQACHSLGQYSEAARVLERNVTLLDGELRREMFGLAGLPSVFSRVWLALGLAEQGKFEEGMAQAREAVATAEGESHAFSLVVAHAGCGTLRGRQGDYANAIESLERGLAICQAADISLLFPVIAAPLGWVYARAGRHDQGVRLLQEAVHRAEAMEFAANHALRLAWLGEACQCAGDRDAAKRLALRALQLAQRHGERGHEAYALRLLTNLAIAQQVPDLEKVAELHRAALTLAQALGMQPLAAELAS